MWAFLVLYNDLGRPRAIRSVSRTISTLSVVAIAALGISQPATARTLDPNHVVPHKRIHKHHRLHPVWGCRTYKCDLHVGRWWARTHRPPEITGWAIPAAIVMCESGGSNDPPNYAGASGYYQIKEWYDKGGHGAPFASEHSKGEQDAIARHLYAEQGTGPWVSSEGCWGGRI